jgi:hypothetical protein
VQACASENGNLASNEEAPHIVVRGRPPEFHIEASFDGEISAEQGNPIDVFYGGMFRRLGPKLSARAKEIKRRWSRIEVMVLLSFKECVIHL